MPEFRISVDPSNEGSVEIQKNINTVLDETEASGLARLRDFLAMGTPGPEEGGPQTNNRIRRLRDGHYYGTYDPMTENCYLKVVSLENDIDDEINFSPNVDVEGCVNLAWSGRMPDELTQDEVTEEARADYAVGRMNTMLSIVENAPRFPRTSGLLGRILSK